jgi:membrane-associated phospholipid phosphatase
MRRIAIRHAFVWFLATAAAVFAVAQPPETQQTGADRLLEPAPETAIPLKRLPWDILHQQETVWTFPAKTVRGQHWKPVLAVGLITAGLVALDPHTESYFHDRVGFSTYKTGPLRGRNSTLAITLTPAAFYLTGLAKHRRHSQNTGLLAAEAVADTQIVSFAMKHAFGRLTPSQIPPHGDLTDTWFQYRGSFTNGGSFPSGHAASAFAVASVIAGRYRAHRWVPWVAYGTAAFLSLTRLPDQAHFPSDVFFGAALGYGVGHFAVLGH